MTTQAANTTGGTNIVLGGTLLGINFFIIVLNVLAIMVIIRFRHKNAIDIFVLTLAMTDLLKGVIPVPMSIYIYMTNAYLKIGTISCNFFGWIAFFTNSAAMLILTLMAMERFWAVVKPFAYKRYVTTKKVQIVAAIAMLLTAVHSTLPLLGVGRMLPYNNGAYSHFDYSTYSNGTIAYSMFIIIYGFGMIAVVMIAYGFVFYKIRNLINRHRRMSFHRKCVDRSARGLNLKTEKMFSYLTVALMILFWISWFPFLIVVVASQRNLKVPLKDMDLYAIRIAVVNSMLNPLACAALCKPYRRGILFYLRVMCSYAGFKRPDSDIWDPWRRGTASTIRRNTRKVKETEDKNGQRIRSVTDMGGSSLTDSTAPTDYNRYRLPSDLDTYEAYRQKRRDSAQNLQKEDVSEERRLSTLPEIHHETELIIDDHIKSSSTNNPRSIANNNPKSIVNRSIDSGIDGSPDTLHEKQVESTEHQHQQVDEILPTNETYRDLPNQEKDHNKNFLRTGTESNEATPAQRRKLMLLDRVQKYLGTKCDTMDVRNSLEMLRSSIASERDYLLTNTDIESPIDNNDNVFANEYGNERKTDNNNLLEGETYDNTLLDKHGVNIDESKEVAKEMLAGKYPINAESALLDHLKMVIDTDEKRKSQSCSNVSEFLNNSQGGGCGTRDSCIDARPHSCCEDLSNTKSYRNGSMNTKNIQNGSVNDMLEDGRENVDLSLIRNFVNEDRNKELSKSKDLHLTSSVTPKESIFDVTTRL